MLRTFVVLSACCTHVPHGECLKPVLRQEIVCSHLWVEPLSLSVDPGPGWVLQWSRIRMQFSSKFSLRLEAVFEQDWPRNSINQLCFSSHRCCLETIKLETIKTQPKCPKLFVLSFRIFNHNGKMIEKDTNMAVVHTSNLTHTCKAQHPRRKL